MVICLQRVVVVAPLSDNELPLRRSRAAEYFQLWLADPQVFPSEAIIMELLIDLYYNLVLVDFAAVQSGTVFLRSTDCVVFLGPLIKVILVTI